MLGRPGHFHSLWRVEMFVSCCHFYPSHSQKESKESLTEHRGNPYIAQVIEVSMESLNVARRDFLLKMGGVASVAWMNAQWPAIVAAAEHAHQAAAAKQE